MKELDVKNIVKKYKIKKCYGYYRRWDGIHGGVRWLYLKRG